MSLQAMRATSHRHWQWLLAPPAGPRQVFARFVERWSWHAHGISAGTLSQIGGFICAASPVSQHDKSISHPPLFFLPPPSGRVLLCGPFAHYLRFCSSEALGKVRLFASFILIVRSFSIGDRKTSPGQHPPASTQPLILSRLWSLLAISSL